MGENMIALRCSQCGSNNIKRLTQSSGTCEHCGASVYVKEITRERELINPLTTPTIKRKNANCRKDFVDDRPLIEKAYTFNVMWDQVEFLRSALISIASDSSAPDDIFDGEIKPVFAEMHHYYCLSFDHEIEYSCTIGYNRENGFSGNAESVTDWRDFSDSNELNDVVVLRVDRSEDIDGDRFIEFAHSDNQEIPLKGTRYDKTPLYELNKELKEHALYLSQNNVDGECISRLPGDENEDYYSTIDSTLKKVEYYVVEDYVLNIIYNGGTFGANAFSGVKSITKRLPYNKIDIKDKIEKETKKEYKLAMSYMAAYAVFATLLLFIKGFFTVQIKVFLEAIAILLFIPCAVFQVMYELKKFRASKVSIIHNSSIKKRKVEALLAKMNLASLTPDENKMFDNNKEK